MLSDEVCLWLPWPPSVNHYYIRGRYRVVIGRRGVLYRKSVHQILEDAGSPRMEGLLSVSIKCYPPDRRKRDLDNLRKCLYDSLTDILAARQIKWQGLFHDDCQIVHDSGLMCEPQKDKVGVLVTVRNYKGDRS